METKFLPISDIFYPFSSYHGETSFDDIEEREIENIHEQHNVPENEDWFLDYNFLDELRKECSDLFLKTWQKEIAKHFEKYGYKAIALKWFVPREYNFKHDSLDLKFEFTGNHEKNIKTLEKELVYYIDNIRKKSCDGYMSFEPDQLKDVEIDDSCILYAIASKEGIHDEIKEMIQDLIQEDFREIAETYYSNAIYDYLEKQDWYKKELKKQAFLDYQKENQLSIPIST